MQGRLLILAERVPKRLSAKATYDCILQAADQLISERGIKHTTINSIISKAGVGPQTLYDYFPDGKPDILLTLSNLRRRRIKHMLRTAIHHVVISSHMEDMLPEHERKVLPMYVAVRIILSSIFQVVREKPKLDRELFRWLVQTNHSLYTEQERLMVEDLAAAMKTITKGSISDADADTVSIIMTFAVKGVLEAAAYQDRSTESLDKIEQWLVQAFATMIAHHTNHENACAGCFSINAWTIGFPHIPEPPADPPVTETIPTKLPAFPTALLRMHEVGSFSESGEVVPMSEQKT